MPVEKIEHKHTYSLKSQVEAKKLMEIKNLLREGQKKIGFDQKLSDMLDFFFDKIAEGKTVSVVDQTTRAAHIESSC